MPSRSSLLDLKSLNQSQIQKLFETAEAFSQKSQFANQGKTGALLFFEPSTRTRMSFEVACMRLGYYPLVFDINSSSLEKGETLEDSILNINALGPDFLIIRCKDDLDLAKLSQNLKAPIINAGWGVKGHPTQALLDTFTMFRRKGKLDGLRVLIMGDIRHSRVAASHFELAKILNYKIALFGPKDFLPQEEKVTVFDSMEKALDWAEIVMCLRAQFERHQQKQDLQNYNQDYGLNSQRLSQLKKETLIFHPGPIHHGVEMTKEVLDDPRSCVLQQVQNGVYVRQALIHHLMKGEL